MCAASCLAKNPGGLFAEFLEIYGLFFSKYFFDLHLVESVEGEPLDIEGLL